VIFDEMRTLIGQHEECERLLFHYEQRVTAEQVNRTRVRDRIRQLVVDHSGIGIPMVVGNYTLTATDLGLSIRDKAMTDKLNDHARVAEELWDDE
jgi:ABC-type hemin transport system substrate-binding protein